MSEPMQTVVASPVIESSHSEFFGGNGRLPRRIGLWTGAAILVGSTIGSGIFRSPASIADKLPGPLPLLAIWLTGGIFALCGALTLAEIAGAFRAPAESTSSSAKPGADCLHFFSVGRSS